MVLTMEVIEAENVFLKAKEKITNEAFDKHGRQTSLKSQYRLWFSFLFPPCFACIDFGDDTSSRVSVIFVCGLFYRNLCCRD